MQFLSFFWLSVNFERKKDKINTPIILNKINYSGTQKSFIINKIIVRKEDFSHIRMIFFTMAMLQNDIGRLFSTAFYTNFDLFFLFSASRSHGLYCYFWKYNFYFSPEFFESLRIAGKNMEKLSSGPSLGPIRGQTLAKKCIKIKIVSAVIVWHFCQKYWHENNILLSSRAPKI